MSTTISAGATILRPILVDGYSAVRESRNIVHHIIGRQDPDITRRPASLRSGSLRLLFADEAESLQAEDVHANGITFVLTSTERASIEMTYVLAEGQTITRELDDETRELWLVIVPFQEIRP